MTLSKREKRLLFALAIIAIVSGGVFFFILPMYRSYASGTEMYDNLQFEKYETEIKLMNEGLTQAAYQNVVNIVYEIFDYYPSLYASEDIDRKLTGLCLESGMMPLALSMSAPQPLELSEMDNDMFISVTANMRVNGGFDSLKQLIALTENTGTIRITNIGLNVNKQEGFDAPLDIMLTFEVIMGDI